LVIAAAALNPHTSPCSVVHQPAAAALTDFLPQIGQPNIGVIAFNQIPFRI
jgi:hypothetical protein